MRIKLGLRGNSSSIESFGQCSLSRKSVSPLPVSAIDPIVIIKFKLLYFLLLGYLLYGIFYCIGLHHKQIIYKIKVYFVNVNKFLLIKIEFSNFNKKQTFLSMLFLKYVYKSRQLKLLTVTKFFR